MAVIFEDVLFWALIGCTGFTWTVSIPLYILVMCVIVRFSQRSPFNSQFFVLFFALGLSDLGCYLGHFMKILGCLGILPEFFFGSENWLVRVYILWLGTLSLTQYAFIILLTLNRFVVICLPTGYQWFWTRKFSLVLIFILTSVALAIVLPVMYDGAEFRHVPANDSSGNSVIRTAGPVWLNPSHQVFFGSCVNGLLYILLGLSVICYSVMIVYVYSLKRNSTLPQNLAIELRLALVGALLFISCGCVLGGMKTIYALANGVPALVGQNVGCVFNAIANFSDLHNQWALFIVSGETRKAVYHLIYNRNKWQNNNKKKNQIPAVAPCENNQVLPIQGSVVSF